MPGGFCALDEQMCQQLAAEGGEGRSIEIQEHLELLLLNVFVEVISTPMLQKQCMAS